jgi:hypothetical protein
MTSRAMTAGVRRAGVLYDWIYIGGERFCTTSTIDGVPSVSALLARVKDTDARGKNNTNSYHAVYSTIDFCFH